jgi:hypothetical protein
MKTFILSVLITAYGTSLFAQQAEFDRLYSTYKGEEGVVALWIPGFLMKLASCIPDLDRAEKQLLRSLRSVTVLTVEEPNLYPELNFTDEINFSGMRDGYHMLLEVHDDKEDVVILAREVNSKISDLIVVVGGIDNVLIQVRGRMNGDLLGNLARVAGIDELHYTSQLSPN